MTEINRAMPRPTAQVEPYVQVLGAELAAKFILAFGGSEIHLAADPKGRSAVERLIGQENTKALAAHPAIQMKQRVPLARKWLVLMLAWQGWSHAQIARTVRTSDNTVRRYVKEAAE